jgi:hypothetical protein
MKPGLNQAIGEIRQLRDEFWQDVKLVGAADNVNQSWSTPVA